MHHIPINLQGQGEYLLHMCLFVSLFDLSVFSLTCVMFGSLMLKF